MATKDELSQEINEILDTDIEWDRMLEDDLRHFHELVVGGDLMEPLAKQYVKKYGKDKFEDEVDNWYPGKFAGRMLL